MNDWIKNSQDEEGDSGVAVKKEVKTKRPPLYMVLLHNDDYTTMEFVVYVLKKVFFKTDQEAQAIMLQVHQKGNGVCGIYTYEIAESKAAMVTRYAREKDHPLKCTVEPER